MAGRQTSFFTALFCISQMFHDIDSQHCGAGGDFYSIYQMMLKGHTHKMFKTAPVGGGANFGRVDVYRNGHWGTVCDHHWTVNETNMVCRQLGFSGATQDTCCAKYGQGSGPIWMNDVHCQGGEAILSHCRSNNWGVNKYDHREDAVVVYNI